MKEPALVIIKPDGMTKGLVGNILTKFVQPDLEIVGMRLVRPSRTLVEEHYKHIKRRLFFEETVSYFLGRFHKEKKLLAIVYYGEDAIRRCRKIAGTTNPEEADPASIRGSYGRITTEGIYENVVHVSSNKSEAQREIKLWFEPEDIVINLFRAKKVESAYRRRVWT